MREEYFKSAMSVIGCPDDFTDHRGIIAEWDLYRFWDAP